MPLYQIGLKAPWFYRNDPMYGLLTPPSCPSESYRSSKDKTEHIIGHRTAALAVRIDIPHLLAYYTYASRGKYLLAIGATAGIDGLN